MQLVINKEEHYIPNKWSEISLRKYMQFMSTYNSELSEAEQQLHIIACFTGADPQLVEKMPKRIANKASKRIADLMEQKAGEDLILQFTIDDIEYGFHPNMAGLKLKEFVDLDNLLDDNWKNMHKIMSILYRPITKQKKNGKYDIEDYDFITAKSRADLFLDNLSIDVVNGAASFFLTIAMDYVRITQAYSNLDRRTRRKRTKQTKKHLAKLMGGMA